jgi:hypothetical protein
MSYQFTTEFNENPVVGRLKKTKEKAPFPKTLGNGTLGKDLQSLKN